jgi:hypothetical protein
MPARYSLGTLVVLSMMGWRAAVVGQFCAACSPSKSRSYDCRPIAEQRHARRPGLYSDREWLEFCVRRVSAVER